MNTTTNTPARSLTMAAVQTLDMAAQATAWTLGKFTRITGGGAFWVHGGALFLDAWTEDGYNGGGSLTIRVGRLELVADWRA